MTLPPGVDPVHVRATATVYYQAWAPYYLALRTSATDDASKRLREFVDRLDLSGTPLEGWRLPVASGSADAS